MAEGSSNRRVVSGRVCFIYALTDPRDESVRYVGKSFEPYQRFKDHIKKCRVYRYSTHKNHWLRVLFSLGLVPLMTIIESTTEDGSTRERFWIAHFRSVGCVLTNATDGGEGMPGFIPSLETRAKLSAWMKGKPGTFLGRTHTPETRATLSAIGKLRITKPETRVKISDAVKNRPYNPVAAARGANANRDKIRVNTKIISPGDVFGRLTAVSRVRVDNTVQWVCICICERVVTVSHRSLWQVVASNGTKGSRSCGCLKRDLLNARNQRRKEQAKTRLPAAPRSPHPLRAVAESLGISFGTISTRMSKGWSFERATTTRRTDKKKALVDLKCNFCGAMFTSSLFQARRSFKGLPVFCSCSCRMTHISRARFL